MKSKEIKMPVQTDKKYYTPEEYLELEEKAEYKNEYRDGEIVPMTGGTTNHNKIILNFCRKFPLTIEEQDYDIYAGDVRLWIPRYRVYTYPDVMVIKGNPVYEGTGTTTITNPLLIVEVLSNSTKNYDQGDKFDYYRSLGEFREYILIDQYNYHVKQFAKNLEGKWVLTEYEEEDSVLLLESVNFSISFRDIYQRVNFELNEK
jgi:Uma2 family endonuclease